MKKNVIGHMMASKEPVAARLRRWNVLPKLFCLLLALVIWLAVTELNNSNSDGESADSGITDTAS